MQTILQKLTTLGYASIHSLLDSAANSSTMSLPVAEQRLRQLEEGRKFVDNAINQSQGRIDVINERKAAREKRIAQLVSVMTAILTDDDPTNDHRAEPKMAEKMRLDAEQERDETALQKEIAANGTLTEALQVIQTRNAELGARIKELKDSQHTERAQAEAASTLSQVGALLGDSAIEGLDSTLNAQRQRQATSAVALKREMDNLKAVTGKEDQSGEVKDALAAFKATLKKSAAA